MRPKMSELKWKEKLKRAFYEILAQLQPKKLLSSDPQEIVKKVLKHSQVKDPKILAKATKQIGAWISTHILDVKQAPVRF